MTYTSRAKQELKLLRGIWGIVEQGVKMLENQAQRRSEEDWLSWFNSTRHNEANKMEGVSVMEWNASHGDFPACITLLVIAFIELPTDGST